MNVKFMPVDTELLILAESEKLQSGGRGRHRSAGAEQPLSAMLAESAVQPQDANEREHQQAEAAATEEALATTGTPVPEKVCEKFSKHFARKLCVGRVDGRAAADLVYGLGVGSVDEGFRRGQYGWVNRRPGDAGVDDARWGKGFGGV